MKLQRRMLILLTFFLLVACASSGAFLVSITFPDEAAKAQTAKVLVAVVKPDLPSKCGPLLTGAAKLGDSGYVVEDQVETPYPLKTDPRSLNVVGAGRRLFFAEGSDLNGQAILRGCAEAVASGGGVHQVTVALAWLKVPCQEDKDCDDQNPCTDDTCNAEKTCLHANNTAGCDDGKYCTPNDSCVGGICTGTGDRCPGQKCDEAGRRCVECTTDVDCDDQRGCTDDSCDPITGTCAHLPNQALCQDDGIFCNGSESCAPAAPGTDPVSGCAHSGNPCMASGKVCREATQQCVGCASDGDCDDNLSCTDDHCDLGTNTCTRTPNNSKCADDGIFCNGTESCAPTAPGADPASGCAHGGNPCSGGDVCNQTCNESAGNCYDALSTSCDDRVFCNGSDSCDGAGTCLHTGDPCVGGAVCKRSCDEGAKTCFDAPNTSCDDGVFCNGTDSCDGAGTCQHSGDPCAGGAVCNQTCNELAGNCFDAAGSPCPDTTLSDCRSPGCSGGTCQQAYGIQPPSFVCRPSTGECDLAESCNGVSRNCPYDAQKPDYTVCASGICCSGACQGECCADDDCHEGNFCTADSCISGSCIHTPMPSGMQCIYGDLVTCDSAGNETAHVACPLGCNDSTVPNRCYQVNPSNVDPSLLCANSADLSITSPATIDTDQGTISGVSSTIFNVESPGGGAPDLGIFSFNSINISADVTVTGSRAVVLLACHDVTIGAVVQACASGQTHGPGGWDGGGDAEMNGQGYAGGGGIHGTHAIGCYRSGGGGSGYGDYGGIGGDAEGPPVQPGGPGGQAYGNTALIPLLGGSGGGGGTFYCDQTGGGSPGGGGGGAVEIVAGETLTVSSGGVDACGAGGMIGTTDGATGGGGGSGGGILLEGITVIVSGILAANGGGGSGGDCEGDALVNSTPGQEGQFGNSLAAGGAGGDCGTIGGSGGQGGAGTTTAGETPVAAAYAGGGGGGAAGRIRVNTASGAASITGTVSPDASTNLFTQGTIGTY